MLTPRAVENADLLRAVVDGFPDGRSGLAGLVGRDRSNLNRTLRGLIADGLVTAGDPPEITDAGLAMVAALDRAEPATGALIVQIVKALRAVSAIRPTNWDDDEDAPQLAAWRAVDAALAAVDAPAPRTAFAADGAA